MGHGRRQDRYPSSVIGHIQSQVTDSVTGLDVPGKLLTRPLAEDSTVEEVIGSFTLNMVHDGEAEVDKLELSVN